MSARDDGRWEANGASRALEDSAESGVGEGEDDDQRADAEVDEFVADEYRGELAEHRGRPVVGGRWRADDVAVDAEAARDDGGAERVEVARHDHAPGAGTGLVH